MRDGGKKQFADTLSGACPSSVHAVKTRSDQLAVSAAVSKDLEIELQEPAQPTYIRKSCFVGGPFAFILILFPSDTTC